MSRPITPRPALAITMGDPAGIGPEVIVKALASPAVWRVCRPVVIGSVPVFRRELRRLRSEFTVTPVTNPLTDDADAAQPAASPTARPTTWPAARRGQLPVCDPLTTPLGRFRRGHSARGPGAASVACIHAAVHLARAGHVAGMVTAPINKEAIHLAGYAYPGHTELLADLTKAKQVGMMLTGGPLKILFVTTHQSLRSVPGALTAARVFRSIRLAHHALRSSFGVARPRIGVAGLNPHAGEHGLFGHEERAVIAPAVRRAARAGIRATGPLPADTLFGAAARGTYDAVVAMYHDQGLIPLKTVAFGRCVNLTVGLPIIRTSVDHGTAYDIAGKTQADPTSLLEAIKLAARLAGGKNRRQA